MECTKTRYRTKTDADSAIQHFLANSKFEKIPQRSYLCPNCHSWHLTSYKHTYQEMEQQVQLMSAKILALEKSLTDQNKGLRKQVMEDERIKQLTSQISGLTKKIQSQAKKYNDLRQRYYELVTKGGAK